MHGDARGARQSAFVSAALSLAPACAAIVDERLAWAATPCRRRSCGQLGDVASLAGRTRGRCVRAGVPKVAVWRAFARVSGRQQRKPANEQRRFKRGWVPPPSSLRFSPSRRRSLTSWGARAFLPKTARGRLEKARRPAAARRHCVFFCPRQQPRSRHCSRDASTACLLVGLVPSSPPSTTPHGPPALALAARGNSHGRSVVHLPP